MMRVIVSRAALGAAALGLIVFAGPARAGDPCATPGADDAFEDNDSCQTPVPIAPGTYNDLIVRDTDLDFYAVVLQPAERVDVRDPDQGAPRFTILDGACSQVLSGPSNFVNYTNSSQVAETVVIGIEPTFANPCQVYDMEVTVAPNPCVLPPEGDSCSNPTPIDPGSFFSLSISLFDADYFSFCLPAGESVEADVFFADNVLALDLDLFLSAGACTSSVGSLDVNVDNVEITYTNTTGVDQIVVARVAVQPILLDCGTYDLSIATTGTCSTPAVYCTGKLSSAGCVPVLDVSGFPSASAPLPFQVDASDVVNWKNGIVFYGFAGPINAPFLGGTLCVTPPLKRSPVMNSGGSPPNQSDCTGTYDFDFNAWIQSGLDPLLVAGQQVNAQVWFRDPPSVGGAGLSNATEFVILP